MYAARSTHPVQEEQTIGVVDLVLERDGLEAIGDDLHELPGDRELTMDNQTPSPGDVPGEVRHGHAALATSFLASRADNHRIAEHKKAVTRAGLGMTRDVHAEHPGCDTDLVGRQSDTAG